MLGAQEANSPTSVCLCPGEHRTSPARLGVLSDAPSPFHCPGFLSSACPGREHLPAPAHKSPSASSRRCFSPPRNLDGLEADRWTVRLDSSRLTAPCFPHFPGPLFSIPLETRLPSLHCRASLGCGPPCASRSSLVVPSTEAGRSSAIPAPLFSLPLSRREEQRGD